MNQEQWSAVDDYITDQFALSDPVLEAALESTAAAGMPAINVTPSQGRLLAILAQSVNAKSILEIGTLGGYSTILLARVMQPGGKLITLEYVPKHAEVAQANLERAGLTDIVEIRVGVAMESLPQIAAEGHGPFDFVFIDADKVNNPGYFEWSLKLTRPGSLIVVDNVIRKGAVVNPDSEDTYVQGVRRFNEMVAAEPRVSATTIQTVGAKGYDGFALIRVNGN